MKRIILCLLCILLTPLGTHVGNSQEGYIRKATIKVFRNNYIKAHPELSQATKEAILGGSVFVGMTDKEVKASLGPPERVNRTVIGNIANEQWIYYQLTSVPGYDDFYSLDFNRPIYVYVENGVVIGFQGSQ